MRFAYLLPLGACAHHCCTSEGLVALRDRTNRVCGVAATVYRREQGQRRFSQKLDSEDDGEHPGELARRHIGDPLARGKGPELSTKLPDQELGPCEGLQRGLGEACAFLDTSLKIPELSTEICISLPYSLPSAFTLIT